MNKLMMIGAGAAMAGMVSGCATGLTEEARNTPGVEIWYDNANVLVDANDPDLKADSFIGVPALDAVVDGVKDIVALVPTWATSKVEQKVLDGMYMTSAKQVSSGDANADLVMKGEAFKAVLLFDTFADEVAHVKAAEEIKVKLNGIQLGRAKDDPEVVALKEARKANYAENENVKGVALEKVITYANGPIYKYQSAQDDASRKAVMADAEYAKFDAQIEEVAAKIKACIATSDSEEAAKAAVEKLYADMGVQKVDWAKVGELLQADLEKIQKAVEDLANALQEPTLQQAIATAAFGGEIVPGTSGKETLATIARFGKQVAVSGKLLAWLIAELAH